MDDAISGDILHHPFFRGFGSGENIHIGIIPFDALGLQFGQWEIVIEISQIGISDRKDFVIFHGLPFGKGELKDTSRGCVKERNLIHQIGRTVFECGKGEKV